jgi:hypothetical protein
MSERDIVEEFAALLRGYAQAQTELLDRVLREHHRAQNALVDRLLGQLEELLASPRPPQPPAAPPPRVN